MRRFVGPWPSSRSDPKLLRKGWDVACQYRAQKPTRKGTFSPHSREKMVPLGVTDCLILDFLIFFSCGSRGGVLASGTTGEMRGRWCLARRGGPASLRDRSGETRKAHPASTAPTPSSQVRYHANNESIAVVEQKEGKETGWHSVPRDGGGHGPSIAPRLGRRMLRLAFPPFLLRLAFPPFLLRLAFPPFLAQLHEPGIRSRDGRGARGARGSRGGCREQAPSLETEGSEGPACQPFLQRFLGLCLSYP